MEMSLATSILVGSETFLWGRVGGVSLEILFGGRTGRDSGMFMSSLDGSGGGTFLVGESGPSTPGNQSKVPGGEE